MNTKFSIFTSGGSGTSKNTNFGVYEWTKTRSYTEKQNNIFCFFYAFIYNN